VRLALAAGESFVKKTLNRCITLSRDCCRHPLLTHFGDFQKEQSSSQPTIEKQRLAVNE
jgi:hypothetical protein